MKIASSEFYDVMQEQAAFGSIKDPKFIEFEILRRAGELQIPVTKDNLKITRAPYGIETIDPDYHFAPPESAVAHRLNRCGAGLILRLWRDRILKIEDHHIGIELARFGHRLGVRGGQE